MEMVTTSFGEVPVWGEWGSDRPLVLAIRGVFPPIDRHADLDPPGADLALLHLPGFHSPLIRPIAVETFAKAFDEVIAARFAEREITVAGTSTGSLVALAMQAPQIAAKLAVEPFFSTAKLWPLVPMLRELVRRSASPLHAEWVEAVFGYAQNEVVDRSYAHLAEQARPTLILAGDVPLMPPRRLTELPSLCDEGDRARLPCKVIPGGHAVPAAEIRAALADLARLRAA